MQNIVSVIKEHFNFSKKTWYIKAGISAAFICLSVFLIYIFGSLYDRPAPDEYFLNETFTGSTSAIIEEDILVQSFVSPFSTIRELKISLDRLGKSPTIMYVVRIYENDELLMVEDFKTQEVDDTFNILSVPIINAYGNTYRLEITVGRITENNFAALRTMPQNKNFSNATLNGEDIGAPIAISLNSPPSGQANTYTVLLILLAICIVAAVLLLGKNPAINSLVVILAFGAFLCVLNPINDSPDEDAHYMRAETVAQFQLFTTSTSPVDIDENIHKIMVMKDLANYNFARFSDAHLYSLRAGNGTITVGAGTAASYVFYGYIGSAIGLIIGKILHLPAMFVVYLCRAINLFIYAIICFFAIQLTPKFKTLFSFLTCFPLFIYLAASFNTDGLTFALSFLLIAYLIYLCNAPDKSLTIKHLIIFGTIALLLALTKIPFIAFSAFIFCIPKNKFSQKNYHLYQFGVLGMIAVIATIWLVTSGAHGLRVIDGANSSAQIHFMLQNPGRAINTLLNTFFNEWSTLYTQLFTLGLLYYNFAYVGLIYPFVTYFCIVSEPTPKENTISIIQKAWGTFIVLAVVALTYLAMYISSNAVSALAVLGIQGRYFGGLFATIPFLLPVTNQISEKEKPLRPLTYALWACGFMVICVSTVILRHYM